MFIWFPVGENHNTTTGSMVNISFIFWCCAKWKVSKGNTLSLAVNNPENYQLYLHKSLHVQCTEFVKGDLQDKVQVIPELTDLDICVLTLQLTRPQSGEFDGSSVCVKLAIEQ